MISFPKEQVLAACQKYGPLLLVPSDLDGIRVMAAIAQVESTMGMNCGPRFEEAYFDGGKFCGPEQKHLNDEFGYDAASSFGPWQLMFINCPGYTPDELKKDLNCCARAFVAHFNNYVIRGKGAKTLEEIGMVWNGGHIFTGMIPMGVEHYCMDLEQAYKTLKLESNQ